MTIFQTPHTPYPPSLPPSPSHLLVHLFLQRLHHVVAIFQMPHTPYPPSLPPPHHTYWSTCFCSASTMLWLSFRCPTPPTPLPFPSPLPITLTGPLVSAAPPPYYDYLSVNPSVYYSTRLSAPRCHGDALSPLTSQYTSLSHAAVNFSNADFPLLSTCCLW